MKGNLNQSEWFLFISGKAEIVPALASLCVTMTPPPLNLNTQKGLALIFPLFSQVHFFFVI